MEERSENDEKKLASENEHPSDGESSRSDDSSSFSGSEPLNHSVEDKRERKIVPRLNLKSTLGSLLSPLTGRSTSRPPLDPSPLTARSARVSWSNEDSKALRLSCSQRLGVGIDDIHVFTLEELDASKKESDPDRIAALVEHSTVSLAAIEEILNENQRLKNELEALRKENENLSKRLEMSEDLRREGHQALQEVKEELTALHFEHNDA